MSAAESVETRFEAIAVTTGKPVKLAMQQLSLSGEVLPVGARLAVRHVFRSAERKPIEVIYSFGLPRDAALRRFEIFGEGFRARSELKPVEEAAADYEKGIERGHLAAMARQYRDGLVNLSTGNIRPGEEVTVLLEILSGVELRDDGLRFRFPFTLAPSYHGKARAAEVGFEEGEVELPREQFGDLLLPRFRKSGSGLHEVTFDLSVHMLSEIVELTSASHAVRVQRRHDGVNRVVLAPARDVPDRDLVLDVRTEAKGTKVLTGKGEDGRGHFAAVIPSYNFGEARPIPRNVVLLVDRSGSMGGTPIEQARKSVAACLAAIEPRDSFGIIAFDNQVEAFRDRLVEASPEHRKEARAFLDQIEARGGTELAQGVTAAARMLSGVGGDIFILTDGQVFGTEDILSQARQTGFRIHVLGIGSASQDRFLALLARETGGVSRFVTPRERVDLAAVDLFASASRPVANQIEVQPAGVTVAPDPPAAVFAGSPLLVFGSGTGSFSVRRGTDRFDVAVPGSEDPLGETLRLIRGSRLITDAESRIGSEDQRQDRVLKYIESLSREYGLASRRMALVAVVERAGDQPGAPPKTQVVPVGMPQDVAFASYFGGPPSFIAASAMPHASAPPPQALASLKYSVGATGEESGRRMSALFSPITRLMPRKAAEPSADAEPDDLLVELASRLDSDGSMPGRDTAERVLATLVALLAFLSEGHSTTSGAFRMHVRRMVKFLESGVLDPLSEDQRRIAGQVLDAVRGNHPPKGDWATLAKAPHVRWEQLDAK